MEFQISKADLMRVSALAAAAALVDGSIPILQMTRITAGTDGFVTFEANDLDSVLSVRCKAEVLSAGSVCTLAQVLAGVAKRLPAKADAVLHFDEKSSVLAVAAGKSKFTIQALPSDDFPGFKGPDEKGSVTFEIQGSALNALLEKVSTSIGSDPIRYYLCGVYLHVAEGKLRAVATDGHRLSLKDVELPNGAKKMPGVILPAFLVKRLANVLPTGAVTVTVSPEKIKFEFGEGETLISKLINGTFPDYARVIPTEFPATSRCRARKSKKQSIVSRQFRRKRREPFASHSLMLRSGSTSGQKILMKPRNTFASQDLAKPQLVSTQSMS